MQQGFGAVAIVHIGRGDMDRQQQTVRVYDDVAFAAADALARIEPRGVK